MIPANAVNFLVKQHGGLCDSTLSYKTLPENMRLVFLCKTAYGTGFGKDVKAVIENFSGFSLDVFKKNSLIGYHSTSRPLRRHVFRYTSPILGTWKPIGFDEAKVGLIISGDRGFGREVGKIIDEIPMGEYKQKMVIIRWEKEAGNPILSDKFRWEDEKIKVLEGDRVLEEPDMLPIAEDDICVSSGNISGINKYLDLHLTHDAIRPWAAMEKKEGLYRAPLEEKNPRLLFGLEAQMDGIVQLPIVGLYLGALLKSAENPWGASTSGLRAAQQSDTQGVHHLMEEREKNIKKFREKYPDHHHLQEAQRSPSTAVSKIESLDKFMDILGTEEIRLSELINVLHKRYYTKFVTIFLSACNYKFPIEMKEYTTPIINYINRYQNEDEIYYDKFRHRMRSLGSLYQLEGLSPRETQKRISEATSASMNNKQLEMITLLAEIELQDLKNNCWDRRKIERWEEQIVANSYNEEEIRQSYQLGKDKKC